MENQKVDDELNLAVSLSGDDRLATGSLKTGFEDNKWTVIVKYIGQLEALEEEIPGSETVSLFNGYGIVKITEEQLGNLSELPMISYIEKPKKLYFSLDDARRQSCINGVQGIARQEGSSENQEYYSERQESYLKNNERFSEDQSGLTGKGIFVAIIDSGIDYRHPAFLNQDGKSRIFRLWDQTATEGTGKVTRYLKGREYTNEEINQALQLNRREGYQIVPVTDTESGHGTAVAGIAVGNGAGSTNERYRGIATESELLIVKLAQGGDGFSKTTEVMEALDYVLRVAIQEKKPISINLSFGTNLGAHTGRTLFENYIASLQDVWKNVICIAMGNEGDARHHAFADLKQEEEMREIPFAIGEAEQTINLQIWKVYFDDIVFFLEAPDGSRRQLNVSQDGSESDAFSMGGNRILAYYGGPTPFSVSQEIYLEWIPEVGKKVLNGGRWKILVLPVKIRNGKVNLWLPTEEAIGLSTGFLQPTADVTMTIPATARNIISIGAYRGENESTASFSGRGNTADGRIAPDLVAPGVGIMTTAVGGGYRKETGTSFATPIATGSAALLMEWGIVRGKDPYLYGEKIKAYFIDGTKKLPGFSEYPNVQVGWGALCVEDSIPK